jgi:hypothetical protein
MPKFTQIGRKFQKTLRRDSFMFIIGLTYVLIALFCFLILFYSIKISNCSERESQLRSSEDDMERLWNDNEALKR